MTILVTGSTGLVGGALVAAGAEVGLSHEQLDITDVEAVGRCLDQHGPQGVVNAAAMANVDRNSREPTLARAVNAVAPGVLARLCAERGIRFVHLSTDYVLTGPDTPGHRLVEDAPPDPRSDYARFKLEGERAALAAGAVVVRLQWVYDPVRSGFFARALAALGRGESLRLVVDQVGSPTPAAWLAPHLLRCAHGGPTGLFHLACAGEVSAWGWIAAGAAASGLELRAEAVRRADLGGAFRPARSCLDSTRFARAWEVELTDWRVALQELMEAGTDSPRGRSQR